MKKEGSGNGKRKINFKEEPKHRKQVNSDLVLQYLLKNSDENNVVTTYDIIAFFEKCGINAERRSIYRDIKEINKVSLMLETKDCTIYEAEEMLLDDEDNELKLVVYDKAKKGLLMS